MTNRLDISDSLALWTQRILGIAQAGLAFATSPYDIERFQELLQLAAEMATVGAGHAYLDSQLADQLADSWQTQLQTGLAGYPTPKVGVGAIVFNQQDQLLLVHNTFRGDWFVPGGLADLGYTPAEIAQKEALEEAGVEVTPLQLVCVADSLRHGFSPGMHVYSLLFYCRLDGGEVRPQTAEIDAAGFFSRDNLPSPLTMDVTMAFEWHQRLRNETYFD
ncbi:MAG: NUDIX hydrolase N-terminal domain-containing protein [Caldilineaceae bacterium]|nr:NUDIX hydrolase N-terminal domain-containing protein [Caldilineaceae bacterium]